MEATDQSRGRPTPGWLGVVLLGVLAQLPPLILGMVGTAGASWAVAHLLALAVPAAAVALQGRTASGQSHRGGPAPETAPPPPQPAPTTAPAPADVTPPVEASAAYATVAGRGRRLVDQQLALIERLERDERDPERLKELFALDHLATRLNREVATLLVLAGEEPHVPVVGRPPMSEVLRSAVGEVEEYPRVDLDVDDDPPVAGSVVGPLVHVLAELLANATAASQGDARVVVRGHRAAAGAGGGEGGAGGGEGDAYVVTVTDQGGGMPAAQVTTLNALLSRPPSTVPEDRERVGLHVVAHLAARLGITVALSTAEDASGTVATIRVPAPVLQGHIQPRTPPAPTAPAARPAPAAPAAPPAVGASLPTRRNPTAPTGGWSYSGHLGASPGAAPSPEGSRPPADLAFDRDDIDALQAASRRPAGPDGPGQPAAPTSPSGQASPQDAEAPAPQGPPSSFLDAAAALLADLPGAPAGPSPPADADASAPPLPTRRRPEQERLQRDGGRADDAGGSEGPPPGGP